MERTAEYDFSKSCEKKWPRPIDTDTILMEITLRCYVGCEDCYKGRLVTTKSEHIDKNIIKERLHWVKEHSSAKRIVLIGGEPLLHPDFQEIVKNAQDLGFDVKLITAGQISSQKHEQDNYQFMLNEFEQGKLDFELSYQPGRNERAFKRTYKDAMERASKKRERLEKVRKYMRRADPTKFKAPISKMNKELEKLVVFSTVTVPEQFGDSPEKFKEIYKFLLETAGIQTKKVTVGNENIPFDDYANDQFKSFGRHFGSDGQNISFTDQINYKDIKLGKHGKVSARIWGPVKFQTDSEGRVTEVVKQLGSADNDQICPAMQGYIYDSFQEITMQTPTIRSDGELTFSVPSCIASPVGLLNVDESKSDEEIYLRLRSGIEAIRISTMQAMRIKTRSQNYSGNIGFCKLDSEYPSEEGKNVACPSCPFNVTCNTCLTRTKEQRDDYYEAIKEAVASK